MSDSFHDIASLIKTEVGISLRIIGSEVARWHSDLILKQDKYEDILEALFRSWNLIVKGRRML